MRGGDARRPAPDEWLVSGERLALVAVGLGCTHFPFLRNRIKRILGPGVSVYDPSKPVARRVRQLLVERDALATQDEPTYTFFTTGDADHVRQVAAKLLRHPVGEVGHVEL